MSDLFSVQSLEIKGISFVVSSVTHSALGVHRGLTPGSCADTNIHGCSSHLQVTYDPTQSAIHDKTIL